MEFTRSDIERLKATIEARQAKLIGQPQGIDECKQGVIASAAMMLVNIILSEINEKGKFGWLSGFRIISKLIKAANDLVSQYKACQGAEGLKHGKH